MKPVLFIPNYSIAWDFRRWRFPNEGYNEENVRQVIREESYEEGRAAGRLEGKIEAMLSGLKEKGTVSGRIRETDHCGNR